MEDQIKYNNATLSAYDMEQSEKGLSMLCHIVEWQKKP